MFDNGLRPKYSFSTVHTHAKCTFTQIAPPPPLAIRNIVVEVSYIVQTYSYYYDNLNTLHIYRSVLIDILWHI